TRSLLSRKLAARPPGGTEHPPGWSGSTTRLPEGSGRRKRGRTQPTSSHLPRPLRRGGAAPLRPAFAPPPTPAPKRRGALAEKAQRFVAGFRSRFRIEANNTSGGCEIAAVNAIPPG